jgi:hypothetical protein
MRHLPSRDEAAPYLELGMRLLPEGDSDERAKMLMVHGAWSWGFGELVLDPAAVAEDRRASEEAVAMARRLGNPWLLSAALDTLGATGSILEGYRGVLAPQWERLELIPQLDDVAEITDIYGVTAWGLTHVGDFRRAVEFGEKGLQVTEETFTANYVPGGFAAVSEFRLGEWDAFWDSFRRIEATFDPSRPVRYHAHRLYAVAAYIAEVTGDPTAADRHIERLDRAQVDLGPVGISGARSWIVAVLVRRGAFAEARERLAVHDPVRDIQNRDLTYEAWADLIATEGTWEEAPAIVEAARAWASKTGLKLLPFIADRLEGQAALAQGDAQAAVPLLTTARDGFDGLEAVWERGRTDLSLAAAHRAAGDEQAATAAARAAAVVFERLGAARELAQANALVAEVA